MKRKPFTVRCCTFSKKYTQTGFCFDGANTLTVCVLVQSVQLVSRVAFAYLITSSLSYLKIQDTCALSSGELVLIKIVCISIIVPIRRVNLAPLVFVAKYTLSAAQGNHCDAQCRNTNSMHTHLFATIYLGDDWFHSIDRETEG